MFGKENAVQGLVAAGAQDGDEAGLEYSCLPYIDQTKVSATLIFGMRRMKLNECDGRCILLSTQSCQKEAVLVSSQKVRDQNSPFKPSAQPGLSRHLA